MADAFDWLSVLQKVFEKYGSQLHKNQVKKFAAKVARKQGRTEDKRHLQKAFKSFLDTEMGRNNVTAKDDMLSFGPAAAPPQAQSGAPVSAHPPAQARLSLFDLAEAAATLSTASRQASPAPTKSTPTKGKSPHGKDVQQSAPAVPKGQRSARKSKGGSSSPDAEATPAAASASAAAMAASSDGMQTRGRATRRPSIEKQPSGRSALPSKPKTKADKASKAQKQFPQPSTAHTASAATQDASPAVSKPEDIAQTLAPVPSTSDAAPTAVSASHEAEGKPKKQQSKHKEKVGDGSQPAIQAQPLTAAAADGKAIGQQDSPSQQTNSLEPSAEAALAGGAAPSQASAELEAVTGHKKKSKKKRKHSEGLGPGEGTTAAQDAPHAAGAAAEEASAAAPVSEAVQGLAADGTTVKAASKLKKRKKQKHGEDATASRQAAVPSPAPAAEAAGEAAEAAAVLDGGDPAASQADPGIKHKKKKKRKSKHSGVADQAVPSLPFGSETAAAEAGPSGAAMAAAAATAAEASTAQHEAAAPASEPAAKPKKRKRKHTDTQAQQSAVAAPSSTRLDDAAPTKPAAAETTSQPSEQTAAAAAAAAHDSVPSEEQPAPKAKRKRNSKASDAIPSAEAGVTPVEEAAEQAAAEAAGPAAAQKKARAKKSKAASPKDKASITVSALQSSWRENAKRQDVKKGKFTKQEKDTLKAAAIAYAQEHNLPTTDFAWLFSTRSLNSEYKGQAGGAWRSISESLPHRTNKAVYACGTRMLHERNYQGKWSKEEDEQLRQLVGEKGSKWAEISHSLGRLAEGCRDRWRELKLGDAKLNGRWNKDETERLRTLVNAYMTQKQANDEERSTGGGGLSLTLDDLEAGSPQAEHTQSDGRIILDDIDWDLVSEQHGTRSAAQCLTKWYTQLAPSMVTTGEWGSGDDRRLLRALLKTGAAEDFQVDWGQLVPTRTAHQARRRWRLMLKCVKDANDREFSENLEMLVSTFTPDLLLPSGTSPPKPAKARTPKKSKGKEVVSSPDAAEYPGMSGGMY